MKRILRIPILLLLCLTLVVTGLPAAAAESGETTLLLQTGGTAALRNGELYTVPPSRYASNGAVTVPLREVAEAFGAEVTWDAMARTATVVYGDHTLRFKEGSWTLLTDGAVSTLTTPPDISDGHLYIPLQALTACGLYVHTFGYYDGGYLVISQTELTEEALAADQATAVAQLGPNAGLFERQALLMRSNSRWICQNGQQTALCEKGESLMPYAQEDGVLMLPLQVCAEAFGATYTQNADGSATVVYRGKTVEFPAENGFFTVDSQRVEHPYLRCALRDGTVYCSLYAFSTGLGIFGYTDSATGALVLSPWSLTGHETLRDSGLSKAASLPTAEDESVRGYIALTFDDGPSGSYSMRLLDGLKARGAHATFFLCQYRISTFPQSMDRYLAEGHEIGNHSATHATLTACSSSKLASELDNTNTALQSWTGVKPTLMRPPGGAYNSTVLSALKARGMSCVLWSVDSQDWLLRDRTKILNRVLPVVGDGDIVLFHDMSSVSVDTALELIDTLQAQGYRFVTVSELAEIKGVTMTPGTVYTQF